MTAITTGIDTDPMVPPAYPFWGGVTAADYIVAQLKELEDENKRLKEIVADQRAGGLIEIEFRPSMAATGNSRWLQNTVRGGRYRHCRLTLGKTGYLLQSTNW